MVLRRDLRKLSVRPSKICISIAFKNKKRSHRVLGQLGSRKRLCKFSRSTSTRGGVPTSSHFMFIHDGFHCLCGFVHCRNMTNRISKLLTSLNISSRRFSSGSHKFSFHFSKTLSVEVGAQTKRATTSVIGACARRRLTSLFCLCKRLGITHGLTSILIHDHRVGGVRAVTSFLRIVGPFAKGSGRGGFLTRMFRTLHVRIGSRVHTLHRVLRRALRILGPNKHLIIVACRSLRSELIGGFLGANGFRKGTRRSFFKGVESPFHLMGGGIVIPSSRRVRQGPHSQDTGLEVTRLSGEI